MLPRAPRLLVTLALSVGVPCAAFHLPLSPCASQTGVSTRWHTTLRGATADLDVNDVVTVALTRESGKNDELRRLLEEREVGRPFVPSRRVGGVRACVLSCLIPHSFAFV